MQVILYRCIQISAEVRPIFLPSLSLLLRFVTEWTSGDRTQKILWNTTFDTSVIYHNVTLQTPAIYTEILDQPEWGTLYFAAPSVSFMAIYLVFPLTSTMQGPHVSYQSGSGADCRNNFTRTGYLNLQQDKNHSISDRFTVFALAYDLYISATPTQTPVIWAIGYTTDLAINYTEPSGAHPTPLSPYYKTRYPDDKEMVSTYSNSWGEICLIAKRR